MTIIDTATVSALLVLVTLPLLIALVAIGVGVGHAYFAGRPARTSHRVSAAAPHGGRFAH